MQLKLKKLCKKLKIRLTRKVGKRRIYKNVSVLKKQIKNRYFDIFIYMVIIYSSS